MITLLAIQAPHGAVLDFGVLFAVILLGPILVAKARIPGIIGLLLGGYLIGEHGTGLIDAGNQTIPELGQLGLLYLMFAAGLELDLKLLGQYRKAAVSFGLLTFLFPFLGGLAVGIHQGWTAPASLLLGSLLASHTLILYPTVRNAGRGSNPAVASAVGATVLTDTIALVVLAGVAGSQTGSGSTAEVLLEVAIGLVVLVLLGLLVVPRVALAALRLWGGDRAARYLVSIVTFLLMAIVAEVFGIEGIVGAFFAGLALNRLVPNEGPSMERIEFFGGAVFIPVFLVSVGLLLDPAVMFTRETLGIGALLCVGCLGGKALAAAITRPLLGFSAGEAGLMFVLTTPQAAATLAATLVGFEIGLFGTAVVNAVLLLILVSILVSTVLATRYLGRVPVPEDQTTALGDRVLVATGSDGPTAAALRLAEALTSGESGLVDLVIVQTEDEVPVTEAQIEALEETIFRGSLDGHIRTTVDTTVAAGVAHAALGRTPSAIVLDRTIAPHEPFPTGRPERLAAIPTVVVRGDADAPKARVVLVSPGEPGTHPHAEQVAALAGGRRGTEVERVTPLAFDPGTEGAVVVVAVHDWAELDGLPVADGSLHLVVVAPVGAVGQRPTPAATDPAD